LSQKGKEMNKMNKKLPIKSRARIIDIVKESNNWQLVEVREIVENEVIKRILAH